MLKKEARAITGGLSKPSKMPGPSYNLPAAACVTGAKLAKIPGTVCYGCYALKGRYRFSNVRLALARRLESLQHPRWVEAMTALISGEEVFRWHDSGDLQSSWHLKRIFEVCSRTPDTWHWLPTREAKFLPLSTDSIPKNLIIRVSGTKVNGAAPSFWPWTSQVTDRKGEKNCPAPDQGGKCRSCRQCWDRSIPNIVYAKH